MIFAAIVHSEKFGTDRYTTVRGSVDEAKVWLDFIVDVKSTPTIDYVTLQIRDDDGSYRAIVTINNPIAYAKRRPVGFPQGWELNEDYWYQFSRKDHVTTQYRNCQCWCCRQFSGKKHSAFYCD